MIVLSKGDNTASCTECNAKLSIPVPLTIPAFTKWVDYQEEVHKTCMSLRALNARRFRLINLEIERDLTAEEAADLNDLNAKVDALVDKVAPLPEEAP